MRNRPQQLIVEKLRALEHEILVSVEQGPWTQEVFLERPRALEKRPVALDEPVLLLVGEGATPCIDFVANVYTGLSRRGWAENAWVPDAWVVAWWRTRAGRK